METDEEYMKILKSFQDMAKMPRSEGKDRVAVLMATCEEYRESNAKLKRHQRKMLDHIENACRVRLDMPIPKKTLLDKLRSWF